MPIWNAVVSFAGTHQDAIEQACERFMDADLEFLTDRDAELWMPLFAVCSVSAPDRMDELTRCAASLSGSRAGDDADDCLPLKLLADIKATWPEGQEHVDTATLIEKLKALEESPWAKYELSPHKVAKMPRPFGVESRSVRIGSRTPKGYDYPSLKAAFDRYLEVSPIPR